MHLHYSLSALERCSKAWKAKEREARITKSLLAFAIAAMRPRRQMCIYVTNLYKYIYML